jgi:DNA mismatch endonuclease (patch repair protein)
MGYRFRLHRKDLPGKPDIVLPKFRKAIFVHGCFWHAHGCSKGQPPKSRPEYWLPKLELNAERDRTKKEQLESLGWRVLVVWQCETKDIEALTSRVRDFVDESENAIDRLSPRVKTIQRIRNSYRMGSL